MSEDLKQNILDSVSAKIHLIDQFSNQIIKSSEIIVEQLNNLSKAILSNLEEQRKKYLQILQFVDTEITGDHLTIIEKEVAAVLAYEKSRESCYEQKILKESASASNRREEHLRLGRDLIDEVLTRTLIYLEMSNIYAGQIGIIKHVDFIYHGEIENKLMHGIGIAITMIVEFTIENFRTVRKRAEEFINILMVVYMMENGRLT